MQPPTTCAAAVFLMSMLYQVSAVGFDGINPGEKYCEIRRPTQCCEGRRPDYMAQGFHNRDDECTMPINVRPHGETLCYCDEFCDRTPTGGDKDCCPDYDEVCKGIKPEPIVGPCRDQQGNQWRVGETVQMNCWTCTCTARGWESCRPVHTNLRENPPVIDRLDPDSTCLIQPKIITENQNGRFSWRAGNYSQFWGKTLKDGVTLRLGTMYPEDIVRRMSNIKPTDTSNIPESFDARTKWPNSISGVQDQENCGASWAFSTVSVAADRNAIMANSGRAELLSPQHLLSCNQLKQRGCDGGSLDRAWWYIRKYGIVDNQCYTYQSGRTNEPGSCQINLRQYKSGGPLNCPSGGGTGKIHKITPSYKVKNDERQIMNEILLNGPVQATFKVYEDFFMYHSGVYKKMPGVKEHPDPDRSGYHSVKIIGWGTIDSGPGARTKYWLAQNSWGTRWGEDGLFKILRGENHCEIESFVIGAVGYRAKKKRRLRKLRRRKLLL